MRVRVHSLCSDKGSVWLILVPGLGGAAFFILLLFSTLPLWAQDLVLPLLFPFSSYRDCSPLPQGTQLCPATTCKRRFTRFTSAVDLQKGEKGRLWEDGVSWTSQVAHFPAPGLQHNKRFKTSLVFSVPARQLVERGSAQVCRLPSLLFPYGFCPHCPTSPYSALAACHLLQLNSCGGLPLSSTIASALSIQDPHLLDFLPAAFSAVSAL